MLSIRLKAIAGYIDEESKVIDVGCDHALLDIYLTKKKHCKCTAVDISEKCILKAKKNIKDAGVNVDTIVSDGLKNIKINDEIIVLSGLGTKTITSIIPNALTNDLIISSHKNLETLRRKMHKKGYYIYDEKAIFDKKYYVIMYFKKGRKRGNYYVSRFLVNDKGYMSYLLSGYEKVYKNTKSKLKKIKMYFIIRKIKKYI